MVFLDTLFIVGLSCCSTMSGHQDSKGEFTLLWKTGVQYM